MDKEDGHIYTIEYYSAIKRNEIELFVVRWIDLESVTSSLYIHLSMDTDYFHVLAIVNGAAMNIVVHDSF